MGQQWIITAAMLLLLPTIRTESLNFFLHQTKTECFYEEKLTGEPIEASAYLADPTSKISFALFDPKDKVIIEKSGVSSVEVREKAGESGPHKYCFSGRSLLSNTLVYFDYDAEMEGETADKLKKKAKAKFSKHKLEFLKGVRRRLEKDVADKKFNTSEDNAVMTFVRKSRDAMTTDDTVMENSLLYLSILADRMKGFMNEHKIDTRQNFNVQSNNLFEVNLYSAIVSSGMLVSACVQIMIIKSYFTGALSWKIWEF